MVMMGTIFSSQGIETMKIAVFFANFSNSLESIRIKEV